MTGSGTAAVHHKPSLQAAALAPLPAALPPKHADSPVHVDSAKRRGPVAAMLWHNRKCNPRMHLHAIWLARLTAAAGHPWHTPSNPTLPHPDPGPLHPVLSTLNPDPADLYATLSHMLGFSFLWSIFMRSVASPSLYSPLRMSSNRRRFSSTLRSRQGDGSSFSLLASISALVCRMSRRVESGSRTGLK